MRIVFTRRYLRELAAIGDYISQCNPRAAARILNEIHTKTKTLLSANPFIGRHGEIKGTRELVIPNNALCRGLPRSGRACRSSLCPARRAGMAE